MDLIQTLPLLLEKFNIDQEKPSPIEIPNLSRIGLAELFSELGFKEGVEIGVESGAYSSVLCKANKGLHLYAVDPWITYEGYRKHVSPETVSEFYEKAKERLANYNVTIVRKFSMEAVKDFQDRSLDFVFIDGNHMFESVTNDLAEWSKKVKIDGIISGHDYQNYLKHRQIHVVDVVNAYTRAWQISPWFITSDKESAGGKMRPAVRSFFWVNADKNIATE